MYLNGLQLVSMHTQIKSYRSNNINSTMKVLSLPTFSALLLFLGVSNGCIVPECPENSNDKGTYFPSPTDCSKYYVCVHSQAVQMSCPIGLWFDSKLNVCNWPESVNCDSKYFLFQIFQLNTFSNDYMFVSTPHSN